MGYKIPHEELVTLGLKKVFRKIAIVNSQSALKRLLSKEIVKLDPSYKVSGTRARVVALSKGLARMELIVKEGDEIKELSFCPVCKSKLTPIRSKTLYDWEITVGYKCKKCSYWCGKKLRVPVRYIFYKK
ncbi:MAG: hypothetical protein AB1485_00730 [Candidatus Thermoplasmatota archaeon]